MAWMENKESESMNRGNRNGGGVIQLTWRSAGAA
jgi:hypothetical protein